MLALDFGAARVRLAEARAVVDVLADQDALVPGQAHGDAGEGVGRGQAPVVLAAQGRALLAGQGAAQAGVGGEDQDPALVEAELLGEAVDGDDHFGREDAALGRGQADAVVVGGLDDRRALVERDVLRQAVGQAAAERGRVHQDATRGVDGGVVVGRADLPPEFPGVEPAIGLAQGVEFLGEGFQHVPGALRRDRGVVLAAPAPVAVDVVAAHRGLQVVDGGARQAHETLRALQLLQGAADVVRQVDGEAGVAARGALAGRLGLDQGDPVVGPVRRQPPRRRQAREAGADHDPVGADVAVERGAGLARREHPAPAVGRVVARQDPDARHVQRPVRSRPDLPSRQDGSHRRSAPLPPRRSATSPWAARRSRAARPRESRPRGAR